MESEFRFNCPHCDKSLRAQSTMVGRRVKCTSSRCGQMIVIPGLDGEVPIVSEPRKPARRAQAKPTVEAKPMKSMTPPQRVHWPWYVGGAAALSLVAVVTFVISSRGKVQTRNKDGVAAATPKQLTPVTTTQAKLDPKDETSTEPKTGPRDAPTPKPEQPRVTHPGQLQGRWVGKDLTLTIKPDGKGRAELATFSQGKGFFRLTLDQQPVILAADFTVEIDKTGPQLSFTVEMGMEPGQTMHSIATEEYPRPTISYRQFKATSIYQLTIQPGTSSDELVIREADGKINPNPMILKRQSADKSNGPARELVFTELVEVDGNHTAAIVGVDGANGARCVVAYATSKLWLELEDVPKGSPILHKVHIDQPESLLFIAEGGVGEDAWGTAVDRVRTKFTANVMIKQLSIDIFGSGKQFGLGHSTLKEPMFFMPGTKEKKVPALQEGKIYRFNAQREPELDREGVYSVWVAFDNEQTVYRDKSSTSPVLHKVSAGAKVQLLSAGQEPAGWHKVRVGTPACEVGWVQKQGWSKVFFMRKPAT